jgi:hypothetical protein
MFLTIIVVPILYFLVDRVRQKWFGMPIRVLPEENETEHSLENAI